MIDPVCCLVCFSEHARCQKLEALGVTGVTAQQIGNLLYGAGEAGADPQTLRPLISAIVKELASGKSCAVTPSFQDHCNLMRPSSAPILAAQCSRFVFAPLVTRAHGGAMCLQTVNSCMMPRLRTGPTRCWVLQGWTSASLPS